MAMRLAPLSDSLKAAPQALLHRTHMHCEFTLVAGSATVREPQEVESASRPLRPLRPGMGTPPEFHQTRLLRMQL
jgi:hypothetical protein